MSDDTQQFRYKAFISYNHRDRRWGEWLHRALESYRVPAQLVGQPSRYGVVPDRLFPVFRDRSDLPSSGDLGEAVQEALAQAATLVVVCSRNSATSRYVNQEILTFKRLGREGRILALIVDGEPNASDSPDPRWHARECFPQALRYKLGADGELSDERAEPLAADARRTGDGRDNAVLKIIAGILGVDLNALKQREVEAARRRARFAQGVAAVMGVLFLISLALAGAAFNQRNEALVAESKFIANQAFEIAAPGGELTKGDPLRAARVALEGAPSVQGALWDRPRTSGIDAVLSGAGPKLALLKGELAGHRSEVTYVVFSNDGKKVVSVDSGGTARVWDPRSGQPVATIRASDEANTPVAFSPDGKSVVTAHWEDVATLWDSETGSKITVFAGHEKKLNSVDFSSDGDQIVTSSDDKSARIWNAKDGVQVAIFREHKKGVYAAKFSPDGSRLITGADGVRIWSVADNSLIAHLPDDQIGSSVHAFSRDGRRMVTVSSSRSARVWDAKTGMSVGTLTDERCEVDVVEWSHDGKRISAFARSGTVCIWNAGSLELMSSFSGQGVAFTSAVFSPDGRTVVTTSERDAAARVWSSLNGSLIAKLERPGLLPGAPRYSHDSKLVAIATTDGAPTLEQETNSNGVHIWRVPAKKRVDLTFGGASNHVLSADVSPNSKRVVVSTAGKLPEVWDIASSRKLYSLSGEANSAVKAQFSPEGTKILTVSDDGSARLWNAETGDPLKELRGHKGSIYSANFAKDGSRIVTAAVDGTVRVWDVRSGGQISMLRWFKGTNSRMALSPDGSKILTPSEEGSVGVWSANTGKLLKMLDACKCPVRHAEFLPDGNRVITASYYSYQIKLWNSDEGKLEFTFSPPHMENYSFYADVSRDGKLVLASGTERTRVWDIDSKELVTVLDHHDATNRSAEFSSDGTKIVTTADDQPILVWDVESGFLVAELGRHDSDIMETARFSSDDKIVLSDSGDGVVKVWTLSNHFWAENGAELASKTCGSAVGYGRFELSVRDTFRAFGSQKSQHPCRKYGLLKPQYYWDAWDTFVSETRAALGY